LTISPNQSAVNSSPSGFFFNETFQITPLWSYSKISAHLQTQPVVLVPVKPIAFLNAKNHNYALVFFRDSTNQITSRLQVYVAAQSYKLTHPTFSVDDFSGLMYQIRLDGLVENVLAVENGQFTRNVILPPNANLFRGQKASSRSCDCFHEGSGESVWEEMWCLLQCVFNDGGGGGGGGGTTTIIINNGNHGPALNWGGIDSSEPGGGGGGNGGGGNGGGAGFNNNGGHPLNGEIDWTLFDVVGQTTKFAEFQSIYMFQLQFSDIDFESLYFNQKLFTSSEVYFSAVGRSIVNATAIKNNMPIVQSEPDLASFYLRVLASNSTTFTSNLAAGFPANTVRIFGNYLNAEFKPQEVADMMANPILFTQVDAFISRNNQSPNSYKVAKAFNSLYNEDEEFREMVTTWPTIPPFMWAIMEDVGLEILERLIKRLNPAAELSQDAINTIRAFRSGNWLDLAKTIGELGFDIAKQFNPELKLVDVCKEALSITRKIKPLIEPLITIYDRVDAATFGKIYTAMSKITNKGVLDKFGLFIYPNGNKHSELSALWYNRIFLLCLRLFNEKHKTWQRKYQRIVELRLLTAKKMYP
jgi:hypothetical protein